MKTGGRKVVRDWLEENGLEFSELAFENGAGLSRDARISAHDLGTMLRFAWRQPYMPEYLSSLSLSGLDGTLSRRFRDQTLAGKAHLKTGSMDDVTAIAGYLQSRSGRRFAVVALQNETNVHRGPGEELQGSFIEMALRAVDAGCSWQIGMHQSFAVVNCVRLAHHLLCGVG